MEVTFRDAEYILGYVGRHRRRERKRQVTFSGDIGQWNKPLLRVRLLRQADYVVMESTWVPRTRGGDIRSQLVQVVNEAVWAGRW